MVIKPADHGERKVWHEQTFLEEPVWKILKMERLGELYETLVTGDDGKKYRIAAPVSSGDFVRFAFLDEKTLGGAILDLAYFENSRISPKEFLFPQTEVMFDFSTKTGEMRERKNMETHMSVIFGVRPCDCAAPPVLDDVFFGDFQDGYYAEKRRRTLYFGLTCNEHRQGCLCITMGGSPAGTRGMDAAMTDIGEALVLEILTKDALDFVEYFPGFFESAGENDAENALERRKMAEEKAKRELPAPVDEAFIEELGESFDHPVWARLAERCIGCNICTFSCPTCHCFDIQDVVHGTKGRRERYWDSCQQAEYTVHTSGHNPRPGKIMRTRNRVFHKLHYYFVNFGTLLCVGCGRCAVLCPVGNDLPEVIEEIRKGMEKGKETGEEKSNADDDPEKEGEQ